MCRKSKRKSPMQSRNPRVLQSSAGISSTQKAGGSGASHNPPQARRGMATLPTCPQGALQRTRAGSKPGLQVPRPPLLAAPSTAENSEELCRSSRWRPGHAVREEMFAKANRISYSLRWRASRGLGRNEQAPQLSTTRTSIKPQASRLALVPGRSL